MLQSIFRKAALIFAPAILFFSFHASAQFMGVEAGIRQQSTAGGKAGESTKTEMAYQFGLVGAFPMTEQLLFRSGFLYTQRPVVATILGTETKFNYNYFDIPLTVLWKINDFGCVRRCDLALVASADCSGVCAGGTGKTGSTPLVIGGSFKFAPNFGIDVYYEHLDNSDRYYNPMRAVGANLLITFD